MNNSDISGVILAGGRGSRIGGEDKGLIDLDGRPMIAHVIERFAPQVASLLINANRNTERYRAFGYPVVPDLVADFPGPLAGIGAALSRIETPLLAVTPCDAPLLSLDLVARLNHERESRNVDVAVARCNDRPQPVFILMRRALRSSLENYVVGGGSKITSWYRQEQHVEVDFGDDELPFANVNTSADIAAVTARLNPK